jgi:hypothetical protein
MNPVRASSFLAKHETCLAFDRFPTEFNQVLGDLRDGRGW